MAARPAAVDSMDEAAEHNLTTVVRPTGRAISTSVSMGVRGGRLRWRPESSGLSSESVRRRSPALERRGDRALDVKMRHWYAGLARRRRVARRHPTFPVSVRGSIDALRVGPSSLLLPPAPFECALARWPPLGPARSGPTEAS